MFLVQKPEIIMLIQLILAFFHKEEKKDCKFIVGI